jgi:farnesyl-diphosphate farnesyltransferase
VADLDDLLLRTSRTFALSIPRLPEPLRREVTVAYLLFRIADTFEDASGWPKERRARAIEDFARLVEAIGEGAPTGSMLIDASWISKHATELAAEWTSGEPASEHRGYLDLLRAAPEVLEAHGSFPAPARGIVSVHTARTARGMAGFVARHDPSGRLQLEDLSDLREYCYVVAGIVGELLTELFLLEEPELFPVAAPLRERADRFGEALQLVNILKDAAADALEGRSYLPPDLGITPIFELARHDLETAGEYVRLLQEGGAPAGLLAFTALPVELAWRTLDRVEAEGPGAKLTRDEVEVMVRQLDERLESGAPAVEPRIPPPAVPPPGGARS